MSEEENTKEMDDARPILERKEKKMKAVQQEIQKHLKRIGLASPEANYTSRGPLEVDFSYDEEPDLVKLNDGTICKALELLQILKTLQYYTDEDTFWHEAQSTIVKPIP